MKIIQPFIHFGGPFPPLFQLCYIVFRWLTRTAHYIPSLATAQMSRSSILPFSRASGTQKSRCGVVGWAGFVVGQPWVFFIFACPIWMASLIYLSLLDNCIKVHTGCRHFVAEHLPYHYSVFVANGFIFWGADIYTECSTSSSRKLLTLKLSCKLIDFMLNSFREQHTSYHKTSTPLYNTQHCNRS